MAGPPPCRQAATVAELFACIGETWGVALPRPDWYADDPAMARFFALAARVEAGDADGLVAEIDPNWPGLAALPLARLRVVVRRTRSDPE